MRIGFVELLLILLIASLTIGPSAALWVDRWLRRANRVSALAARQSAKPSGAKMGAMSLPMLPSMEISLFST